MQCVDGFGGGDGVCGGLRGAVKGSGDEGDGVPNICDLEGVSEIEVLAEVS